MLLLHLTIQNNWQHEIELCSKCWCAHFRYRLRLNDNDEVNICTMTHNCTRLWAVYSNACHLKVNVKIKQMFRHVCFDQEWQPPFWEWRYKSMLWAEQSEIFFLAPQIQPACWHCAPYKFTYYYYYYLYPYLLTVLIQCRKLNFHSNAWVQSIFHCTPSYHQGWVA